ncbi:hypothetical protein KIN20_006722, partial [Parelaphostrongylus tenuis]
CVVIGERFFHSELQPIRSIKLKEKAQQENLLLNAGNQRIVAEDLNLKDKPRLGRPTKLNNEDLFAAEKHAIDSNTKDCYFNQIRNFG